MKIEIELEDGIYNRLNDMASFYNISLEEMVERLLTKIVVEVATQPDDYFEMLEKVKDTPTFSRLTNVLKKKGD